ncbi:hypothetical protein Pfo_030129, partial [Paulownia fortunei]
MTANAISVGKIKLLKNCKLSSFRSGTLRFVKSLLSLAFDKATVLEKLQESLEQLGPSSNIA